MQQHTYPLKRRSRYFIDPIQSGFYYILKMYIQAIVPWNECNFKVKTIEYSGQWIAVFSFHVKMNFACVVIRVYAGSLVSERRILW